MLRTVRDDLRGGKEALYICDLAAPFCFQFFRWVDVFILMLGLSGASSIRYGASSPAQKECWVRHFRAPRMGFVLFLPIDSTDELENKIIRSVGQT